MLLSRPPEQTEEVVVQSKGDQARRRPIEGGDREDVHGGRLRAPVRKSSSRLAGRRISSIAGPPEPL